MNYGSDLALQIRPVSAGDEAIALEFIWPELSAEARLRQFQEACTGTVPSVALWGAYRDQVLVGVLRKHVLPGRMSTFTPPRFRRGESMEVASQLMRAAIDECANAGVQVVHALLPIANQVDAALLARGGLRHVADLNFLMSSTTGVPPRSLVQGVNLRDFVEAGQARLERVIEATYQGSLDCPETGAARSTADVLLGYRAAGPFDPTRWLVAEIEGQDVGCLLLSDDPKSGHLELTYVGVVPKARGRGLGVQLVRHAQWMAGATGRSRLVTAVDASNRPALRIYQACGFIEWNRLSVFWRAL